MPYSSCQQSLLIRMSFPSLKCKTLKVRVMVRLHRSQLDNAVLSRTWKHLLVNPIPKIIKILVTDRSLCPASPCVKGRCRPAALQATTTVEQRINHQTSPYHRSALEGVKTREKEQETQEEEHLMEEKKKKKQEEKKKKEGAQKKAAEQKTKVPEPMKTSLSQPQPAGTGTKYVHQH
ncbi:uncharacterized protein LOC128854036 [Cuculus canorus]|uniref:uncharacterized protein LOC128854036 n=1 Tax=Cuculus canorus TaxID=55661 RepID=UPI0023AB27F3|nr:uncharacterized protein LOC128854036 [Cuculus canorus]